MYACSVVHVTNICWSNFPFSNFRLVTSKIRYFEFRYLEFSRKIVNFFCLKPHEASFENSTTFHWNFARTKDKFRRISFALLLHNTVFVSDKKNFHSGERFQKFPDTAGKYTGYVWTQAIFIKKFAFSQISGYVWTWPYLPSDSHTNTVTLCLTVMIAPKTW